MKKKVFINPAIYIIFLLAIIGLIIYIERIINTKSYINLAQEISTYVVTAAMAFALYWIGKSIKKPIPITYDQNEIVLKMYFKADIVIRYKDIKKIEFYNRYDGLEIHTENKRYKFTFVLGTKELKKFVKKKVTNHNL